MNFAEFSLIFDGNNKLLSIDELISFFHQLRYQCIQLSDSDNLQHNQYESGFYDGEIRAFNIVLDLLEHLDNSANSLKTTKI